MKRWIQSLSLGAGIALLAFTGSILWRQGQAASPTEEVSNAQQAIQLVARVWAELETKGDLWPGYGAGECPLVITFDNGHIYALGLNAVHPAWEERSILGKTFLFSPADHWGLSRVLVQHDFLVDEQPSFVFHFDIVKGKSMESLFALVGEHFHLYQEQHFIAPEQPARVYLDHFNAPNIAWMQIEEMILADFMSGQLDAERSPFHKAAHLHNFLAVHRQRQQLLHPVSLAWERGRQRLEGMADYISARSMEAALGGHFSGARHPLNALQESSIDEEIFERAVESRHGCVGAALGYALDLLEVPGWKRRVAEEGMSPVQILEEVIELSDEESAARIEKIMNRYGFEAVLQQVVGAMGEYREELDELTAEYGQMEGIELQVGKPSFLCFGGSDNALYCYYLADGSKLVLSDTSSDYAHDGSWRLSTIGAPMAIKQSDGAVSLKVEKGAQLLVDGQVYSLAEFMAQGRRRSFTALSLLARHCEMHSSGHAGSVYAEEGRLVVAYNVI